MNLNDLFTEEKVRLDPKCWTGKKIGNPKTKMKGGTRVNNCVPAESVNEMDKSQTPPGRDGSNDSDAGKKEYTAKATTAKKVAKDGEKILNKELNKKQGVAEGSSLVDRVQQIIEKNHQDGVWTGQDLVEFIQDTYDGRIPDEEEFYDDIDALEYEDNFFNELVQVGAFKQGVAEGDLDEGWKEKLGGAALAGAMALGAGGANARVMPGDDPGINRLTGKPIATQQATDTAPTQSTSSFSIVKPQAQYDVDTQTLTYKGKQYKWNSDAQATGQGEVVTAPSMAVGSRSMGSTKVELNPNGTYTKVPANESQEKVGDMDADKFDAAMARLKQLAGAGPLKTVYDPQKRVYRNVPTAQQPKK